MCIRDRYMGLKFDKQFKLIQENLTQVLLLAKILNSQQKQNKSLLMNQQIINSYIEISQTIDQLESEYIVDHTGFEESEHEELNFTIFEWLTRNQKLFYYDLIKLKKLIEKFQDKKQKQKNFG
eukprot:TRINITY_DN4050_c0_g1_i1.p2 TRINITY_DN4050_c0_g1~~TRINITY_DN4050_c0_g1_i1.p2  ORF type:complete len:123 (-),score=25.09 TRINITY_DN4050_c0_g1_i1:79-447(-)